MHKAYVVVTNITDNYLIIKIIFSLAIRLLVQDWLYLWIISSLVRRKSRIIYLYHYDNQLIEWDYWQ